MINQNTCTFIGFNGETLTEKQKKILEIFVIYLMGEGKIKRFLFSTFNRGDDENAIKDDFNYYKELIDNSNFVFFFFDECKQDEKEIAIFNAFKYAHQQEKFVINIFKFSEDAELFVEIFKKIYKNTQL